MNTESKLYILIVAAALSSCATLRHNDNSSSQSQELSDQQKIDALTAQNKQLQAEVAAMNTKLDSLDTKMGSVNDKVDQTRAQMDTLTGNVGVSHPTTKKVVTPTLPAGGSVDEDTVDSTGPEKGYIDDDAVQKYRSAMILFQAHNYPDAVLSFSSFVDQFPDHPLAGDAQYFLGESYFKQKEYRLAARELNRVLTTYDRSSHVSDALRDLAISEENTGDKDAAERHRQELMSMFPSSPAAAPVAETKTTEDTKPTENVSIPAQPAETPTSGTLVPEPTETTPPVPKAAAPQANPAALDAPPPTAPEPAAQNASPPTS